MLGPVVVCVVVDEEIHGWFVLYDVGEAAERLMEAVILLVVVDCRDFTDEHAAAGSPEAVIEIGRKGDALAGREDDGIPGTHSAAHAVCANQDGTVGQLSVICRIVEPDHEVASSAVDDVLGLGPVEMHGCDLIRVDNHDLLRIDLAPLASEVIGSAVTQGEEEKAKVVVVTLPKICDIPAQAIVDDLANLQALGSPFLGAPIGKGRQVERSLSENASASRIMALISERFMGFTLSHFKRLVTVDSGWRWVLVLSFYHTCCTLGTRHRPSEGTVKVL